VVPPSAVTVVANVFRCSDAVTAVSFHGVRGGTITGNRIEGIAAADAVEVR
jgi:ammonia channel protein AmtB